jgi:hypothetical protein
MTLDGEDNARINLHNGWNLISGPFLREVPWWAIQQSNSISVPLYEFTGGWNTSEHLRPYQGFIFDNSGNLSELIIPYSSTLPKVLLKANYQWRLHIALKTENYHDNYSYLGVSDVSVNGKDQYDFKKPNAVGSVPSVYFERKDWDIDYTMYATDIRSPISEIEKWEFNVNSIPGKKTQLIFSGMNEVPAIFEVVLLDLVNTKIVDLRKQNIYQFTPITELSNFDVLVGEKQFIDLEISGILPQEFSLGDNFPNPFNPSTIIPIFIPQKSDLTLKIYNILGQEIQTVFSGVKEAGKYYFKWDGLNYLNQRAAAGVYLYRLTTDQGHTFTGKMVLVK